MLDFEHPNTQLATIDEFTVARIERLWEAWLRTCTPEQRSKHRFHRNVIQREPGLEQIRLATVYVLLARHDAQLGRAMSPRESTRDHRVDAAGGCL